jgi:hypothetical protein
MDDCASHLCSGFNNAAKSAHAGRQMRCQAIEGGKGGQQRAAPEAGLFVQQGVGAHQGNPLLCGEATVLEELGQCCCGDVHRRKLACTRPKKTIHWSGSNKPAWR